MPALASFGSIGTALAAWLPQTMRISATASGPVFTITRAMGTTSTLALGSASNANLSLSGAQIVAAQPLGTGSSQKAIVRESLGDIAIEYSVLLAT